jgi:diketogulonate reductase-like aldo/keto reductase
MTPAQVALAWVVRHDDVMAIPKTSHRERLKENVAAMKHNLSPQQLEALDELFPQPKGSVLLQMI